MQEQPEDLDKYKLKPGVPVAILKGNWKQGRVPNLWDGNTATCIVAVIEDFLA